MMTFVYMMIMMDNVVEKEDVKDFGHNNNGVEDVLKSTTTSTKMTKKSFASRVLFEDTTTAESTNTLIRRLGIFDRHIHFPRESLVQIHQLRDGDGVEIEQTDTGDSPLLGVAETNVSLVGLFGVRFVSDCVVFFRIRGTRREQTVRRGRSDVVRVWVFSILLLRVRRRGAVERGG